MFNLRRPAPGEDEDELLKLQAKFLETGGAPAAKLVKRNQTQTASNVEKVEPSVPPKGPSVSHREGDSGGQDMKQPSTSSGFPDPFDALDAHDTHISKVLSEIVERETSHIGVNFPIGLAGKRGFPQVLQRPAASKGQAKAGPKKKSLFAQHFAQAQGKGFGVDNVPVLAKPSASRDETAMEVESSVTSRFCSKQEYAGIHQENSARMAAMSEQEIIAEQQKLLQALDPSLVAFLKAKKSGSTKQPAESDVQSCSTVKKEESIKKEPVKPDLPVVPEKDWVNMDVVENEKLSWIGDLPAPPKASSKAGQQARFDLEGNILSPEAELPTHLGLHHHGKEPQRAGYSLEELFQLARSVHAPQCTLALQVISRVLAKTKQGAYRGGVSTAICPALIEGGLVMLLRWALDNSRDITLSAAMHCLHALLVNAQDQEALDEVFIWQGGWVMPGLCPKSEDETTEPDPESNPPTDAQLVKQDLIKGLLQMSLLARVRYVVCDWRPLAVSTILDTLDILTRIAQHSTQSAYQIMQCSGLVDTIVKEFLPATSLTPEPKKKKVPTATLR